MTIFLGRVVPLKKAIIVSFLFAIVYVLFYYLKLGADENFNYSNVKVTFPRVLQEEIDFPIAYGISIYRDGHQFLQLMSLIYRPSNLYCIHVDKKSDAKLHTLVRDLTKEYSNIIIPERFIEVVHSQFSVLESELICMEALLKSRSVLWKYFINLTGQELPLKTNLEIIRILKQLKGANLMEKVKVNSDRIPASIVPPPHGISLWKGAVHIVASREFVDFALHDSRALNLLEYLRKTLVPDETYFSTLNHEHSLKAPGGYSGNLTRDPISYPFLNRYKIWAGEGTCYGQFLRGICIFSMKDVPEMILNTNMKLFANKFVIGMNDDVAAYLRQWFMDRTKTVYSYPMANPFINLTYYSQLTVVNEHF